MSVTLVEFPRPTCTDVVEGLRALADSIEREEYAAAHNVVWVLDEGNGKIATGLLGQAVEPAATAYLLLGLAQATFVRGCLK